jgi:hypothetical protein
MTAAMGMPKFDTGPQKSASQSISQKKSSQKHQDSVHSTSFIPFPWLGAVTGRWEGVRTLAGGRGTYA